MPKENLKDKLDGNELDLSLNNLEVVPVKELAAIPKATHLDLSCNLLTSLPDTFCSLTHLVKLDLSKNQLTELPLDFGQLDKLQHLDLLGNKLTSLPESFHGLHRLKWLDLKDNPLEPGLKKNAGDCLDEKQCQACARRILLYMKELSSLLEQKRQAQLKNQREKEAALKAKKEGESKRKREEKKAQKKRELESRQRKNEKGTSDDRNGEVNGDTSSGGGKETSNYKDKTGRGFCSCFFMLLSSFIVLLALMMGVIIHCKTNLKDKYCHDYYRPLEVRVIHFSGTMREHAVELSDNAYRISTQLCHSALEKSERAYHVLSDVTYTCFNSIQSTWEDSFKADDKDNGNSAQTKDFSQADNSKKTVSHANVKSDDKYTENKKKIF